MVELPTSWARSSRGARMTASTNASLSNINKRIVLPSYILMELIL